MHTGQKVKCVDSSGAPSLTRGKVYEVLRLFPEEYDPASGFTFKALVEVTDDFGLNGRFHVWRFKSDI